eukprot:SAG31_NODE_2651_length_5296_cov_2.101770_2_plen_405_part_00
MPRDPDPPLLKLSVRTYSILKLCTERQASLRTTRSLPPPQPCITVGSRWCRLTCPQIRLHHVSGCQPDRGCRYYDRDLDRILMHVLLSGVPPLLALLAQPQLKAVADRGREGDPPSAVQFECIVGPAHTPPWHPPLPPGRHHCLQGCSWNGRACTLRSTFTELLWQDNFDSLNASSWQVRDYASWMCSQSSTGCVTPEAVTARDGALRLRTEYHPTAVHPHQSPNVSVHYTTGSVDSAGRRSFGPFGRFEARAKVAHAHGLNSALWLMPEVEGSACPWPRCGEIDIMECLGRTRPSATATTTGQRLALQCRVLLREPSAATTQPRNHCRTISTHTGCCGQRCRCGGMSTRQSIATSAYLKTPPRLRCIGSSTRVLAGTGLALRRPRRCPSNTRSMRYASSALPR